MHTHTHIFNTLTPVMHRHISWSSPTEYSCSATRPSASSVAEPYTLKATWCYPEMS